MANRELGELDIAQAFEVIDILLSQGHRIWLEASSPTHWEMRVNDSWGPLFGVPCGEAIARTAPVAIGLAARKFIARKE